MRDVQGRSMTCRAIDTSRFLKIFFIRCLDTIITIVIIFLWIDFLQSDFSGA